MVLEWGMSDRVGPMAWGSQGAVFLGEDLMHSRDYSDETSRVIDEEVERILRDQEERAHEVLGQHRGGLEGVARALLEKETIDGAEVGRLVDQAAGRVVKPHVEDELHVSSEPETAGAGRSGPPTEMFDPGDAPTDVTQEMPRR
jgi:cell division protease FtsH